MKKSEQINEISAALSKAQGQMGSAEFDRINPHFKAKYATLSSLINAAKKPLSDNGLAIIQGIAGTDGSRMVVTMLAHSSGQWLEDDGVPLLLDKDNMQGLGSAFTYAKRFGFGAMLGLVGDEDDDGNAASTYGAPPKVQSQTAKAILQPARTQAAGEYVFKFGPYIGKGFKEIGEARTKAYLQFMKENTKTEAQTKLVQEVEWSLAAFEGEVEAPKPYAPAPHDDTDNIPF